jgi:hypothetical protein
LLAFVFLCLGTSVYSFTRADETDAIRKSEEALIFGPTSRALGRRASTHSRRGAEAEVRVEVRAQNDSFYILFLNELDGRFPVYSRGSYVIKRSLADGSFEQVKIFYRNDPGFFLRVTPDGQESLAEVFAGNSPLHRRVPIPIPFESVLTASFADIVGLTRSLVDWNLLLAEPGYLAYEETAFMAARARDALHTLPDAEDGAMDSDGNLVFIESLVLQDQQPGFNCSGFAKWVADGIYRAITGRFMDIDELKTKHMGLRGHSWSEPREDDRDPYFGLDWSRNIAVELEYARSGRREHPEFADLRAVHYNRYIEDMGFRVSSLRQVLFFEALENPGRFYIGSVNREFGGGPTLRQHVHVVVVFPYFDESGRFRVDVMERNVETSVESLVRRYANDYIHLVGIEADARYLPPTIN